jgi:hypothetical protein
MWKLVILAALFIVYSVGEINAQKCPRTKRTLMVLVLNGTEAKNVRYKIYPVLPKVVGEDQDRLLQHIYKKFQYTGSTANMIANGNWARKVLPQTAEEIIKDYKAEEYLPWRNWPENNLAGSIKDGKVVFEASDAVRQLFLIKITSDNYYPEYLIGNFFGGCSVVDKVELTDYRSWP